jgi:hypothetical protein
LRWHQQLAVPRKRQSNQRWFHCESGTNWRKLSAGLRPSQTDRHAARRAVKQSRTPAAAAMVGHPALPCPPVTRRVWRHRASERRHQGVAGRRPCRADGVGHSAARPRHTSP